jgi:hypothetical protein
MKPTTLLQHINIVHGTTFALLERYADGEQGAFAVLDRTGRRGVMKWQSGISNLGRMQDAQAVTNLLRNDLYPAPHYLFIGCAQEGVYSIQTTLPGSPMRNVTAAIAARLLEINRIQAGCALPGLRDWHQEAVSTVLFGGNGYCVHTSLQHHSQETSHLLKILQSITTRYQHEPHRTGDIVHNDFQHSNVLIDDGQVSGIIDWDAPYAGERVFDIATLLFYAYNDLDVRALLWQAALAQASLNLLRLYFAHLILRQVDWSLRYHDAATSERYIARGWTILQEVERRAEIST